MLQVNPHVAGEIARYDRQEALRRWHTSGCPTDPDRTDRFRDDATKPRGKVLVAIVFASATALGSWMNPDFRLGSAFYNLLYLCIFARQRRGNQRRLRT